MKFEFNELNYSRFVSILDLALKVSGLQGVHKIYSIFENLQTPIKKSEGSMIVEFSEEGIKYIDEAIDVALKSYGLSVAKDIIDLIDNVFQKQVQEVEEEVEAEQDHDVIDTPPAKRIKKLNPKK
jgi:hypothetical protein